MSAVRATRDDGVLTLRLTRSEKHNALDEATVEDLLHHVERAHEEPPDLLVLRGEGPSFSAGFDLSSLETTDDATLLRRFVRVEQLLQAVHQAPFTTMALAHGRVFGAGADLVIACAHRIAAPSSRFRLPGLAFGVVLGTRRLADRIGVDAARAVQSAGLVLDSAEAHTLKFLTGVREPDDWDEAVTLAAADARAVPTHARPIFHRALADPRPDVELAELVRSAAAPGLVDRIRSYRAGALR